MIRYLGFQSFIILFVIMICRFVLFAMLMCFVDTFCSNFLKKMHDSFDFIKPIKSLRHIQITFIHRLYSILDNHLHQSTQLTYSSVIKLFNSLRFICFIVFLNSHWILQLLKLYFSMFSFRLLKISNLIIWLSFII